MLVAEAKGVKPRVLRNDAGVALWQDAIANEDKARRILPFTRRLVGMRMPYRSGVVLTRASRDAVSTVIVPRKRSGSAAAA